MTRIAHTETLLSAVAIRFLKSRCPSVEWPFVFLSPIASRLFSSLDSRGCRHHFQREAHHTHSSFGLRDRERDGSARSLCQLRIFFFTAKFRLSTVNRASRFVFAQSPSRLPSSLVVSRSHFFFCASFFAVFFCVRSALLRDEFNDLFFKKRFLFVSLLCFGNLRGSVDLYADWQALEKLSFQSTTETE